MNNHLQFLPLWTRLRMLLQPRHADAIQRRWADNATQAQRERVYRHRVCELRSEREERDEEGELNGKLQAALNISFQRAVDYGDECRRVVFDNPSYTEWLARRKCEDVYCGAPGDEAQRAETNKWTKP